MTEVTEEDREAAQRYLSPAVERTVDGLIQAFAAHRMKGVLAGRVAMREEVYWLLVNAHEESLAEDVRAIPLEPGA